MDLEATDMFDDVAIGMWIDVMERIAQVDQSCLLGKSNYKYHSL